jgi:hypothetical protein
MNRRSPASVVALAFAGASVALAVLAGAGCEGGKGDPDPLLLPQPFGPQPSIAPLNDPDADPKVPDGTQVTVTGVRVVHVDAYDETGTGAVGDVFLADATDDPGPFQGLLAFRAQTTPPSYRMLAGDIVDISGPFEQFPAPKGDSAWITRYIPEIGNGSVTFRFDSIGAPVPKLIPYGDLFNDALGYQWRTMLVTIENVGAVANMGRIPTKPQGWVSGQPGPVGRASFRLPLPPGSPPAEEQEIPVVNNELFDLAAFCYENGVDTSKKIRRLTGIVKIFGRYNISPRSAADIELE